MINGELITYAENEDLIFSLESEEVLKVSVRLKVLFGEIFWTRINSLKEFEKVAPLSSEFGPRNECYTKLIDLRTSYVFKGLAHGFLVEEIGWYNANSNSIHLHIFPLEQSRNINHTQRSIVDAMEKMVSSAVLFDISVNKVLATNYEFFAVLRYPLSKLGLGFKMEDFFLDHEVFKNLLSWVESDSSTKIVDAILRLKKEHGCWFQVSLSKIRVDHKPCVLAVLKDIDDLVTINQSLKKKNLIFSRLSEVQRLFLSKTKDFNPYQLFLDAILDISTAKYGFVGEVGKCASGERAMKIHAVTDFGDESDAAKDLIQKLKNDKFLFTHFENLFGACIKTGQIICENNPAQNPHSSNKKILGHPQINNFLGIPILNGNEVIGLIGLGNKPGGFNQVDIEEIEPFATTYSVILNALDSEVRNLELEKDSSEKELILSTVGDHSPDTIVVLDANYEFKFLSPGYKKHFGDSIGEDTAKSKIRTLVLKTLRKKYWESENLYRSRLKIQNGNMEIRWLETSINVVELRERKKVIAFIRDVTNEMRHQLSLRASLKKEKEFKTFLSDFMNVIAHEFKTPLATIFSSVDISSHYLAEISDNQKSKTKIVQHLEKIGREAEALNNIVVNSLAYERFMKEDFSLKKEEIKLESFVHGTLEEYHFSNLVVVNSNVPEKFTVFWDRFLMQMTIVNLVGNAIKFSKGKAKPMVSLMFQGSQLVIGIKDFGIGIPEKDLPYIFTPYFRASNARDIIGTGLGLVAVQNFARLHNGKLEIHSKVEQGTEVIISFNI